MSCDLLDDLAVHLVPKVILAQLWEWEEWVRQRQISRAQGAAGVMAAKSLSEGDIPGVTSSPSTAASFCPAQLVTHFYTQLEMEPRTFRILDSGAGEGPVKSSCCSCL